ncbi:ABC transporter permease [Larkinella harenae]
MPTPPRFADRLLSWLVAPHLREEVLGDLHERFQLRAQRLGEKRARQRYWRDTLAYVRPAFIKRQPSDFKQPFFLSTAMINNYLKIAWRNLRSGGWYSVSNIGGLAIVLAVSVLLTWWIKDELSYDRFHADADRIYRVNSRMGKGLDQRDSWLTPAPVAVVSKNKIPGVEQAVRLTGQWEFNTFRVGAQLISEKNEFMSYVDPEFLTVFTGFTILYGNAANPFPTPYSVVMTEDVARRFFGTADAVGRTFTAVDSKQVFTVGAVLATIPENSSIRYTLYFPMSLTERDFKGNGEWKAMNEDWGNFFFTTYVKVAPGADSKSIEQTLNRIHTALRPNANPENLAEFQAQALSSIHLYQPGGKDTGMQQVRILGVIAFFLLSIGCINYVNLTTARTVRRAREVGVRKIIGATSRYLLGQLLTESVLTLGLSLGLAVGLMYVLAPYYQNITGKPLALSVFDPQLWLILVGTLILTLLLAGLYPAIMMASFHPLRFLRGGAEPGKAGLRQALVVTQFALATGLITGTLVVGRQLRYIQQRDLGFDKAYTFTFPGGSFTPQFQRELAKDRHVLAVTTSSDNLLGIGGSTTSTDWDGKDPKRTFSIGMLGVDKDFISTFGMRLVAGQNFTGTLADSTAVILNETAVKEMGIQNPIGRRFEVQGTKAQIIGVVKDFDTESIRSRIKPVVLYSYPQYNTVVNVKTTQAQVPQALAAAEQLWKQYRPDYPFEYTFLDQTYDQLYRTEQRIGDLFNLFAVIAIAISCLGLFGLAAFTAEQRTKEIGIRKVLGAPVFSVVALLSKDFLKLVAIAILIATPVSWYSMRHWLDDFAYKIALDGWMFAWSGILAIGIALLTVSFQSVKAALMNPVTSLRSE